MNIQRYFYRDVEENGWTFSEVEFGAFNLLVGDTATGKTRLLNTIFNLGSFATGKKASNGYWEIVFDHKGKTYKWLLEAKKVDSDYRVVMDRLSILDAQAKETAIVTRDENTFVFNDMEMPKLSPSETSISLLKEEEEIKPIHEAFARILHRRFFHDALSKISEYQAIPSDFITKMDREKDLEILFSWGLNLSTNLYFLSVYFPQLFEEICAYYKRIFPFISTADVRDLSELSTNIAIPGQVPVFCVKEKGRDEWLHVSELSSGMQKVLLILTDTHIVPDGGIYLIDEYENSLGISAIEFLPTLLLEIDNNLQYFVTSHHPYTINNVPIKDWYVFHRKGVEVTIKYGDELVERFGTSKQLAFVQLINDPFYTKGVE